MPTVTENASAASPELDQRQEDLEPNVSVLIKHTGRDARTRTARAARAGHRRQGVTLDDGTRIRKKGRRRFTEVHLRDLVENHSRLLEYLRVGQIEICDPNDERPMAYDEVVRMISSVGDHLAHLDEETAAKAYQVAMEEYAETMKHYQTRLKRWEGLCDEVKKGNEKRKKAGMSLQIPPSQPEEPKQPEPPVTRGPFVLGEHEASVGEGQHGRPLDLLKSSAEEGFNLTPPPEDLPPADTESTGLLTDDGVDAASEGSEEETKWDEEGLLALGRTKLNEVASDEFGVDHPEKLPNKQSVVDAIMAASTVEE